jgi:predicted permease
MDLNLPVARYDKPALMTEFFETLLARTRSLPGVRAAGLVFPMVPGDGYGGDQGFIVVEHPTPPVNQRPYAMHRWADPGYFSAIGIPILRGHTFDRIRGRGLPNEVIVSDAFARQYFPNEEPLGKHLRNVGNDIFTITGVVGDTLLTPGEPMRPMMYFQVLGDDDGNGATLVVRSDRDVTQFALPVQRLVAAMDHDLPVSDILTMNQVMGRGTQSANFDATLLAVFAAVSLVLAAAGLFGVLSYIVAQRTGEIGIRIALGAQRQQVLRKVLLDGLRPALFGLGLGLVASVGAAQWIRSMLYGTHALDPLVFAAVTGTLVAVATLACLIPAWRASRLDPMQALRME